MSYLFKIFMSIGMGYLKESTIYATALTVLDGDTFFCRNMRNSTVVKIRIANIDAPEMGQVPHGLISKTFLSNLITKDRNFRRIMRIQLIKPGSHGSYVAKVFLMENKINGNEIPLQRILLRSGMAFSYEGKTDEATGTTRDQLYAMENRRGMWKWNRKNRPMEPWLWRRQYGINSQEETPNQYIDRLRYEHETKNNTNNNLVE